MADSKKRFAVKKADLIILTAILALCALFAVGYLLFGRQGASVVVEIDGERYAGYPLSEEREIDLGGNVLVISNGQAYMKEADCPDLICVSHMPISKAGQTIVCLPNRVIVRVDGEPETDAVIGG